MIYLIDPTQLRDVECKKQLVPICPDKCWGVFYPLYGVPI